LLPGKCQNIHGHSLQIELTIEGRLDKNGILAGLDFGAVKKIFRGYIDEKLDHHLHLNVDDVWANQLRTWSARPGLSKLGAADVIYSRLPGLQVWSGDPTTENLAKWICDEMYETFMNISGAINEVLVSIQETGTNGAEYILP
jgi:6-pyruvoyl-tetrahydropterin synthase